MENKVKFAEELTERIASFFEMSLSDDAIPFDLFEEKIAWSPEFSSLDRGDAYPICSGSVSDLYKKIFKADETPNFYRPDSRFYWIGEAYAKIYLTKRASFYRISLLLPLTEMKELFIPYHEMDLTQIVALYEKREQERSVLECLKKKQGISYVELIKITHISKSTLFRLKDNNNLQKISLVDANALSLALSCPITCFLSTTKSDNE